MGGAAAEAGPTTETQTPGNRTHTERGGEKRRVTDAGREVTTGIGKTWVITPEREIEVSSMIEDIRTAEATVTVPRIVTTKTLTEEEGTTDGNPNMPLHRRNTCLSSGARVSPGK